jgi:peroxiredoxin
MLLVAACERNKNSKTENTASKTGDNAPDFMLKDINGRDTKLSEYRGKVVLIEFWAKWCPPCRASVPELVALQEKYKNKGFVVLGISVDEGRDLPVALTAFSKEFSINYPILLGNENVAKSYNVKSIPMSFLINKEGKIANIFMGYIENFETSLSVLIEKTL